MPKVGSLGLDMMFRTCTVQVRQMLHFWLNSDQVIHIKPLKADFVFS